MPVSITLSDLYWVAPDGHRPFDALNLHFPACCTGLVGDNGAGKSTLLELISGHRQPSGGRLHVDAEPALLHQSLDGMHDVADVFGVSAALDVLVRAESGNASLEELSDADWTLPERMARSLERFALHLPANWPVDRLSGGQGTRLRLAAMHFTQANFLLMDEPSNHLDWQGRRLLLDLLEGWKGGALVASHDRTLLDVMDVIVELGPQGAGVYGGNGTFYREMKAAERASAERQFLQTRQRADALAQDRQRVAERQARRNRGGRQQRSQGGQAKVLLDAQAERSERTSAAQRRITEQRSEQIREKVDAARDRLERILPLSFTLPPTGLGSSRNVLRIQGLHGGHADGPDVIQGLDLNIDGPQRLRIVGENGSGKSTLLSLINGKLLPRRGQVKVISDHVVLDQHLAMLDGDRSVLENFQKLNPGLDQTRCRTLLSRLQFRDDSVHHRVDRLSGGQRMRAALACTVGNDQPARLLILDEPTNHLDLLAQQELESALCQYDGAMIVISHDEAFIESVGIDRQIRLSAGA